MRLTTIPFHAMTCGCTLDEDVAFLRVCPLHLHAPKLKEACRLALIALNDKEHVRVILHDALRRADGG